MYYKVAPPLKTASISSSDNCRTLGFQYREGASQNSSYALGVDDNCEVADCACCGGFWNFFKN